ncbi:MAG: thiamine diphosphokinase [Oscillospiraceae bacterium]|nr:thiamine diphosphokinase [Oscillospiraceae bacterium]
MANCIIFCAGRFDKLSAPIGEDDYIIAADGGLAHAQALGLTPDAILGDFDSLGYVPEGAQVFPVEKDDTDSMLAVRHGLERGYRSFTIYGALDGQRLDHTIANLQTLRFLADHDAIGHLVGEHQCATVIRNAKAAFPAHPEGLVSVFCMGSDAQGVTIRGLKYGLTDGTLTAGYPLGVSNHFIGEKSEVSVKNGSLLIIFPADVPFPEITPC